jgi:peptidoglycan-associated lipoprotein
MLPACAKKQVIEEEPAPEPPPPLEDIEEPEPEPIIEEEPEPEPEPPALNDIFFDFDKYNIKEEYRSVLARNAEALIAHPEVMLLVEGHCDERGTNEYNLSLGEKRAKVVIDFYITYGVDEGKLSMVSYGEERPFAHGSNEEAWAKNRRAHMVLK